MLRSIGEVRPALLLKAAVVASALVLGGGHWYHQRVHALGQFVAGRDPVELSVLPSLLSGATGGAGRAIGHEDRLQVERFKARGGLVPSSRLDIRDVESGGDVTTVWFVDPGIMWIWHAASRLGCPLAVASIAGLHTWIDLVSFALAVALAWRLAGPYAGALTALLYAWSTAIGAGVLLLTYYPWSVGGSLLAAHVMLSAMTGRRFWPWWFAYCVVAAALTWLRVLWLPVALVSLGAAWFRPGIRTQRQGAVALCVGLVVLGASVGATIVRTRGTSAGDRALLPRAQLWHTLYIGLGWYGNFGPIQWRDEYAGDVAGRAGFPITDYPRYNVYMRHLFLREISEAPLKYAITLGRRYLHYAAAGWSVVPERVPRGLVGCGVIALVLAPLAAGHGVDRRRWAPLALVYLWTIAVWSALVPPQATYTLETLGLIYPLIGAAAVIGLAAIAARRR